MFLGSENTTVTNKQISIILNVRWLPYKNQFLSLYQHVGDILTIEILVFQGQEYNCAIYNGSRWDHIEFSRWLPIKNHSSINISTSRWHIIKTFVSMHMFWGLWENNWNSEKRKQMTAILHFQDGRYIKIDFYQYISF